LPDRFPGADDTRIRPLLWVITLLGLLLPVADCGATEPNHSDSSGVTIDDESYEGWLIDSIEIDNRNIYDLEDERYHGLLFRTANRFHVVTRKRIVVQELLFAVGDRLELELLDETARNLRLRFPLNEAWIEIEELDFGQVLVRVVTIDQWSLVGGLRSISRSGNETNLRIGFEERNFIGRAQFISFDFFARENDPNFIQAIYREPRVFGRSLAIGLSYRSDPHNRLKLAQLSRPFYSLDQKVSFLTSVADHSRRVEILDSLGTVVDHWNEAGETVRLGAGYRFGPRYRKTLIRGDYKYLYEAVEGDTDQGTDSIYHQLAVGLSQAWQRFITERRIRGFGYTEDYVVGLSLGGNYSRSFNPGFNGYLSDRAVVQAVGRWKMGPNLLGASYSQVFWFKGSRQLRRQYGMALTWYNNYWRHVTWAVRSLYRLDRDGDNRYVVLGGTTGLRGYPKDFRAGDRSHVMNFESRLFLGLELLSVKIGSAVFIDAGRTWQPEEKLAFHDYYLSGGVGLRLSLENLLRDEIVSLDVILIEGGEWELAFGTGQYF
jgi:hypothetical protein